MFVGSITWLAFCLILVACDTTVYDVTQFGVDSSGARVSTSGIQAVITEASKNNGGIVYFPKGTYRTGPIELKSGITLKVDDEALIIFVDYQELYPPFDAVLPSGRKIHFDYTPLIRALGQNNISIVGSGIIYGVGEIWWRWLQQTEKRAIFVYIDECDGVLIEGVQLNQSPQYQINLKSTEHTVIKDSILSSVGDDVFPVGQRTDGINCESCRYLHVKNVTIRSGDDGIALQADKQLKATEHVLIENSKILSGPSGVAIGSNTAGGVRNVTVRNCVVNGTDRGLYIKSSRGQGGTVEDIHFYNVTLEKIGKEAIVIASLFDGTDAGLHERNLEPQPVTDTTPFVRNVNFQGIRGNSALEPVFIVGLPEARIANVTINDLSVKSDRNVFCNQTEHIVINGKEQ
uniref:Glycoside hydrolase family protein 28 n=1 Tax=Callosobruchus maculatus TaxID=64391 RepID=E7CIQ4_CALMS|nr:glycoside hydrolase family protein 28 [Callosobruchus maculatus]